MLNILRKRLRTLPRFFVLGTLTIGASLMLGLLSFGGMYAIWPLWPVALVSFALSSVYEGEIYIQNINGAFKKLYAPYHQLQQKLAKQFLINTLSEDSDNVELPAFCQDYIRLLRRQERLKQVHATHHEQEAITQKILDAEIWFSKLLFDKSTKKTPYATAVTDWLMKSHAAHTTEAQQLLKKRQRARYIAGAFSFLLSSTFMGLGTMYLLHQTIAAIPFLAALPLSVTPFAIIPLAIIAGCAYGYLTYHTLTDMIERHTFKKMMAIFRDPWNTDLSQKERAKKALLCLAIVGLVFLAVGLTICTAGTWWTVAKQVHPLLPRMSNLFRTLFAGITAIINGLSSLAFNWQNTMESVESLTHPHTTPHAHHPIRDRWRNLRQKENIWQIFNPFRLFLLGTIYPLRCIFFLGHVLSIGVTGDRIPNVNIFVSIFLGVFSETLEDWHYFFGHDHHHHPANTRRLTSQQLLQQHSDEAEHNHDHSLDLPTRIIKTVFSPVYLFAYIWNWVAKTYGAMPDTSEQEPLIPDTDSILDDIAPSFEWEKEGILMRLQSFKEQHFQWGYQPTRLQEKKQIFSNLQDTLIGVKSATDLRTALRDAANDPAIARHRLFSTKQPTASKAYLDDEVELAAGLQ